MQLQPEDLDASVFDVRHPTALDAHDYNNTAPDFLRGSAADRRAILARFWPRSM